jgi:RNA polymerase sigma factor (sigma-70 family)
MREDSWQDLYGRWKNALDEWAGQEPQNPSHWFSIWRMIIGHAWFQKILRECAGYEIISSRLPPDLADDLAQEVVLLFAGKLARQPDLGMDTQLARQKFPAFLGTIVRNDCRHVARRLRRQFLRSPTCAWPQRFEDCAGAKISRVELSLEIEELQDPQRTILLLHVKGMTLREIAQEIPMNYSKVCREFHHGQRQLAELLNRHSQ